MFFTTASALGVLAIAAHAVAEPAPYMMSSRQVFGLPRRDSPNSDGYEPTQSYCGTGDTCAQACGNGFVLCPSTDNAIHCYNTAVNQACCADGSGNSCDVGYYCAGSATNGTLCCPTGQGLDACAKAYGVTGIVTSGSVVPTSTPSSSYSTASYSANSTTTTSYAGTGSATASGSNATGSYPTTSPSKVPFNGGNAAGPAGAALAVLVAVFAALL